MIDTRRFPGGDEVTIVRKQDIIDCINTNIVDKEVALELVKQCEVDAANFVREGRWAGLPFMGSLRPSPVSKLEKSKEQQELIEAAYHESTPEQYCIFRRDLAHENYRKIKANRMFNYKLSISVNKNRKLFNKISKEKGDKYARLHFYLSSNITAASDKIEGVTDEED